MKKIIIKVLGIFIIAIVSFITFLIFTEKILIRTPVMVQPTPRITFFAGNVKYRENVAEESLWQEVRIGLKLKEGNELKTGRNSFLDIRFNEQTAIRITSYSTLLLDKSTIKEMVLNLEKGSLYGKFEKLYKKHQIKIKTPTTIAAIRGTELGFEVRNIKEKRKKRQLPTESKKRTVETTVYAISGITEVYSPEFKKQKLLLAYQSKIKLKEGSLPGNPEQMKRRDIRKIRAKLNAIHTEDVLLITDKILFKTDSAKILRASYPELEKISKKLNQQQVKVRIDGHTDNKSSALYNYDLSVQRARAIRKHLIKKGINAKRLLVKGYGESKPIANNDTKKGRALNRRVEFIIVE